MDTKFLYVMGSVSRAGKGTVYLGLLAQLLVSGFVANQLAFIQPVTSGSVSKFVSLNDNLRILVILTTTEKGSPWNRIQLCYLGDIRQNNTNSLMF